MISLEPSAGGNGLVSASTSNAERVKRPLSESIDEQEPPAHDHRPEHLEPGFERGKHRDPSATATLIMGVEADLFFFAVIVGMGVFIARRRRQRQGDTDNPEAAQVPNPAGGGRGTATVPAAPDDTADCTRMARRQPGTRFPTPRGCRSARGQILTATPSTRSGAVRDCRHADGAVAGRRCGLVFP